MSEKNDTTTNDQEMIVSLLAYLDGQCRPGYRNLVKALVAERDKAKADFSDLWRERCEFARRIDESDGAIFEVVAERDALRKRVAELEAQPPASDLRERLLESALRGVSPAGYDKRGSESLGRAAVWMVDAAIAEMRKGGGE